MNKKHKLSAGIVERARPTKSVEKIELLGYEAIKDFPRFSDVDVTNGSLFSDNYESDSKVFYVIEKHSDSGLVMSERGIGSITTINIPNDTDATVDYLVREFPGVINYTNVPGFEQKPPKNMYKFTLAQDECLLVSSFLPISYAQALTVPHSILTSSDNTIQLTTLAENSFLGRMEGGIEAVTYEELAAHPPFVKMVAEMALAYINQSGIKTDDSSIRNVSAEALTLAPTGRPTDAKPGLVIYNWKTRMHEGYNGREWYPLGGIPFLGDLT